MTCILSMLTAAGFFGFAGFFLAGSIEFWLGYHFLGIGALASAGVLGYVGAGIGAATVPRNCR